jgi:DNA-directed RNA polymerase specialized sigma24 family protein
MSITSLKAPSLISHLNREWATLAGRTIDCGTAGWHSGTELLATIRQASGCEQDAILHRLLRLGRDGNAAAERVLLQALIPAAQRIVQRVRGLEDIERADRPGYAIGAAWESIRTYRMHLEARVMANLTMNMLRLLAPEPSANERLIAARTITVTDQFLETVTAAWTPEPTPEAELANVLAWAVGRHVLDREEVALLIKASLGEQTHAAIAAEIGLSLEGLRSRLTRIRRRLSAAAQTEYLVA